MFSLAIKRFFSLFWVLGFAVMMLSLAAVPKHQLIKVASAQMQQQMGPSGMQQQMSGMQQQMGWGSMQQQQWGMQQQNGMGGSDFYGNSGYPFSNSGLLGYPNSYFGNMNPYYSDAYNQMPLYNNGYYNNNNGSPGYYGNTGYGGYDTGFGNDGNGY